MTRLNLKPASKAIKTYYELMHEKQQMGFLVEGNVAPAFASLLGGCAKTLGYRFNEQHSIKLKNGRYIRLDGAILTPFNLRYGVWEAKDSADDLKQEVKKKFEAGYPSDNILFQSPQRVILVQDGREVLDVNPNEPQKLIDALEAFFSYTQPALEAWEEAVSRFKDQVPQVAQGLDQRIEAAYKTNGAYKTAFDSFFELCRTAINPNLSKDAVEEMLIQHILTERIFRRVFNNDKFTRQNAIAAEIETVVDALTSRSFSRDDFTRDLNHFYGAIESTASTISDYAEKQDFLNTVYENFFQGFSVKTADTMGIVYTPQPIVQFMVKSVEELLKCEFGRSLTDTGVHILDPFVGTGNFLLRVMEEIRQIKPSALPHKYAEELHCNEIMLLPYYIASMNLEHAYFEAIGEYKPFEGICLTDTFELAEEKQMPMFVEKNTERVERQRRSELTVILGNPPYNANQANENDNNKNRAYRVLDKRVHETYAKASGATNKRHLSDPYVKAFRWASDRLKDEGVIAFVTNNSFVDDLAFDGMRIHLKNDFDSIYVLDLGGNVRKNPKLSGTTHNVFGIQVGVCITFLIRKKHDEQKRNGHIYYARMDEFWHRSQKYAFLDSVIRYTGITWTLITPNTKNVWLTEGMQTDFVSMLPMGTKDAKAGKTDAEAIFDLYSLGVTTNRDTWAYNFNQDELTKNIETMIETYNTHVFRWQSLSKKPDVDAFVEYDDKKISWSETLKLNLVRGRKVTFEDTHVRNSLFRPFTKQNIYYDPILNERPREFSRIFPTPITERENRVICVTNHTQIPFSVQMSNSLTCLDVGGRPTQCFPLYVYDTDGTNRRDNISDWALSQFREHYHDESITKEAIFYYLYAYLHQPEYREKYAQNLKRELPRVGFVDVPFPKSLPHSVGQGLSSTVATDSPSPSIGVGGQGVGTFWHFVRVGRALADLHLNYESMPEYPLKRIENNKVPVSYRVEKMALSKDKTSLKVNDFLTLEGIPAEAFGYVLGNRSALEWVIEQYQVKTDKRSGIVNDPNRLDDEGYIVRLVGQVIHVSVETVKWVNGLSEESI